MPIRPSSTSTLPAARRPRRASRGSCGARSRTTREQPDGLEIQCFGAMGHGREATRRRRAVRAPDAPAPPLLRSSPSSGTTASRRARSRWPADAERRAGSMITTPPGTPGPDRSGVRTDGPVTTLRGAGVDVDPRRALRAWSGRSWWGSPSSPWSSWSPGMKKNSQADDLHQHGVPVVRSPSRVAWACWVGAAPTPPVTPARVRTRSKATATYRPSRAPRSCTREPSSGG